MTKVFCRKDQDIPGLLMMYTDYVWSKIGYKP